jgi:uncharacterized damage-inducible protein DinB
MKEVLLKQMQFEHWANTELIALIKTANPLNARVPFLLSHILNSSNMWLSRIKGEQPTLTLFEERSIESNTTLLNANTKNWLHYIEQADENELNRIVEFIFPLDGSKKRVKVGDAILHIISHSAHHRGQMMIHLKGTVEKIPLLAYLIYSSETVG